MGWLIFLELLRLMEYSIKIPELEIWCWRPRQDRNFENPKLTFDIIILFDLNIVLYRVINLLYYYIESRKLPLLAWGHALWRMLNCSLPGFPENCLGYMIINYDGFSFRSLVIWVGILEYLYAQSQSPKHLLLYRISYKHQLSLSIYLRPICLYK